MPVRILASSLFAETHDKETFVMTRFRLVTLVAVALGVLTLGSTVPAAAVRPQIMRIHLEDQTLTFTHVCDFPFQIVFDVDLTITRFFDQEGNLTRRVVHVRETNAVFTKPGHREVGRAAGLGRVQADESGRVGALRRGDGRGPVLPPHPAG